MQASTRSRNKPMRQGRNWPLHVAVELSGVHERARGGVLGSALAEPRRARAEAVLDGQS